MAPEGSFYSPPAKVFSAHIGEVTIYVNSWRISSQRVLAEQASVAGENIVTNSSDRSMRIYMEGKWVTDEKPEKLIIALDEFIRSNTPFLLYIRELAFEQCRLLKYTVNEKGSEPYIEISLEISAQYPPKEVGTTGE
ncbi:MAG: hypothetical protein ACI4JN_10255 [Ruminococcus sp.]